MARPQSAFFKDSLPAGLRLRFSSEVSECPVLWWHSLPVARRPGFCVSLTQGSKGPRRGQALGARAAPQDSRGCRRCPSWSEAILPSPCHAPPPLPGFGHVWRGHRTWSGSPVCGEGGSGEVPHIPEAKFPMCYLRSPAKGSVTFT